MTTVNPIATPQQTTATAFKGKNKKTLEALDKSSLAKRVKEIIDQMNSPILRAVHEGRSKEEIMKRVIRDAAFLSNFKLYANITEELAKQAAKNGYKK